MIAVTVASRVAVLQRECLTGAGGYEAAFLIAEKVAVPSPVRVGTIYSASHCAFNLLRRSRFSGPP